MTRAFTSLELAPTEIAASCRVWEVMGSVRGGRAAWLELIGTCRDTRDAMWIQWQIDAAVRLSHASALLLDLRDLRDPAHLAFPVRPRHTVLPVLVVAAAEYLSEIEAVVPAELLRTDLDAACAELDQILRTPRPSSELVHHAWTEAWIDASAGVRVLRSAGERFDIFDPATPKGRITPLVSFAAEDLARQWLSDRGFELVEGKRS
jgi:hypothetical protein